jgi:hypothetical protein
MKRCPLDGGVTQGVLPELGEPVLAEETAAGGVLDQRHPVDRPVDVDDVRDQWRRQGVEGARGGGVHVRGRPVRPADDDGPGELPAGGHERQQGCQLLGRGGVEVPQVVDRRSGGGTGGEQRGE